MKLSDPPQPVLQTVALTLRFPGVVALNRVSFDLRRGEVHALCGENGAGKSTLIKTLSGLHPAGSYEGRIVMDGKPVAFRSIAEAGAAGMAVIYQELALVDDMTVAENIFLGAEPRRAGLIDWSRIYHEAQELLKRFHIRIDPTARIRDLGIGQKQLVEIAKALGKRPRILILDEPTAALTGQEVEILLDILRDLRRQGISCIYISHKLSEVFGIADRITVLRDGQSVITLETAQASPQEVIRHMVGREISDFFPRRASPVGAALLTIDGLSVAATAGGEAVLHDLRLEVRAGEVLGIGGLMGAGRTELLMHLFGAWGHRLCGVVTLGGVPCHAPSPAAAIRDGLVLVTEDRKRYGLIPEQDIGFNLSLSSLPALSTRGWIDASREFHGNRRLADFLQVKAPGLETPVLQLSGGNQQKVVLGKALMTKPRVILLDEPTRGIDVGAKVEVYELINRLTSEGHAVVLVSSELPELMGMSDRIIMLWEGRLGGEFSRSQATQERLLSAAMGMGRS
ncbi:MAG: sugar ABC transporter ATP-binding protein [bacterium]